MPVGAPFSFAELAVELRSVATNQAICLEDLERLQLLRAEPVTEMAIGHVKRSAAALAECHRLMLLMLPREAEIRHMLEPAAALPSIERPAPRGYFARRLSEFVHRRGPVAQGKTARLDEKAAKPVRSRP
jgi:hypothetical protein